MAGLLAEPTAETPPAPSTPAPAGPSAPVATGAPPVAPAVPAPVPVDWASHIPAEYKDGKYWEPFKDKPLGEVLKSHAELQKFIGGSVRFPGPDAKPEERDAFNKKVDDLRGVPHTPQAYTITAPEGLGELDKGAVSGWQQVFHRLRLTPEQAAGLTSEFFGSPMGNPQAAIAQVTEAGVAALKKDWGGGFDHNVRLAQEGLHLVMTRSGAPGLREKLERAGLGADPDVLKALRFIGAQYAEGGQIPKEATSGAVLGPERAQQRIAEILADRKHPYFVQGPGHAEAVDEMTRLHEAVLGHTR